MSSGGILQKVRILDFSWVLAGPYATRMLADFGAEVIKIQPLLIEAQDKFSLGYSNNWNRNKLGISLNMGHPGGREIARKLIKISDVVVENFSPRVMTNWGLDYPEARRIKDDIIFLSMSYMGNSGIWKDYTGYGPSVQAFSGLSNLTSYPDHPPLDLGYSYADHIAAIYACLTLLGALEYRFKTGLGQHIDLSQSEALTSLLSETILDYTQRGIEARTSGNHSTQAAPYGVYRCQGEDRWCAISVSTEEEWQGFIKALDFPAWTQDERFIDLSKRLTNIEALDTLVQDWTQNHSDEEIMLRMQSHGVPAGKVQNAADLVIDSQLNARKFFIELDHPVLGQKKADASPIHLSDNPAAYHHASPTLGQDNDYVYCKLLGLPREEIERLKRDGVI
jgi:benzylsuccinate CoA-transferase BbsF subunit